MGTHRGFILQPTYRVEDGKPVVHLYGTLEDGRSFLVRDRRTVPHFYVERTRAEEARALGASLDAAATIFAENLLGGTCARVCPVEALCVGACVLPETGRAPIPIGHALSTSQKCCTEQLA